MLGSLRSLCGFCKESVDSIKETVDFIKESVDFIVDSTDFIKNLQILFKILLATYPSKQLSFRPLAYPVPAVTSCLAPGRDAE